MAECTETLLSKKLETWSSDKTDNFKEEKELTVEITLNEYRNLVKEVATKEYDIGKANGDKWAAKSENEKLKTEVKELESTVFEYRRRYGKLERGEE